MHPSRRQRTHPNPGGMRVRRQVSMSIHSIGCGIDIDITSSRRRRRPVQGQGTGKCRRQPILFGCDQIDAPPREGACRRLADPVPNRAIEIRARR